jgi:hypothetical protein
VHGRERSLDEDSFVRFVHIDIPFEDCTYRWKLQGSFLHHPDLHNQNPDRNANYSECNDLNGIGTYFLDI